VSELSLQAFQFALLLGYSPVQVLALKIGKFCRKHPAVAPEVLAMKLQTGGSNFKHHRHLVEMVTLSFSI
jgi:hypothetical protein